MLLGLWNPQRRGHSVLLTVYTAYIYSQLHSLPQFCKTGIGDPPDSNNNGTTQNRGTDMTNFRQILTYQ